jgi:hypothetical protein
MLDEALWVRLARERHFRAIMLSPADETGLARAFEAKLRADPEWAVAFENPAVFVFERSTQKAGRHELRD